MLTELACWGEFAQAVANHFFTDKYWYVLLAVMDTNGKADKLRRDGALSCPCFNHLLIACFEAGYFFKQIFVHVRTLLKGSAHLISSSFV